MTKAGILTRIAQQTGLQNDDPASFGFPLWNRAIFLHIPLYGTDRQSHSINHNLPDKPLHVLPFRHSLQEYIHFTIVHTIPHAILTINESYRICFRLVIPTDFIFGSFTFMEREGTRMFVIVDIVQIRNLFLIEIQDCNFT